MSTAPNDIDSLPIAFRAVGLTTILREYEAAITRAEAENWGYRQFLHHLVELEASERLSRKIERLLKDSDLPPGVSLMQLEQSKIPEKARRQLPTLLSGDFVRRGDNLLCFGLPGRGKSFYVAALARALIEQHQMRVLFIPTFRLVTQLIAAKRDLKLPAFLDRLDRYDAVVLDDVGYVQQVTEEMEVLFTFFAHRYEQQKSLLITSNLVFSEWDKIFRNPMTTMAVVDRLVHRAIILEFRADRSIREEIAAARRDS
jgi:DNA replication protein DnaC